MQALGTTVRMTVFRRLQNLAYVTSYSHRGKYYALKPLSKFGEDIEAQGVRKRGGGTGQCVHFGCIADGRRIHDDPRTELRVTHLLARRRAMPNQIGYEMCSRLAMSCDATSEQGSHWAYFVQRSMNQPLEACKLRSVLSIRHLRVGGRESVTIATAWESGL